MASVPIVVSITTLPSRVGLLRPTLETLIDGHRTPDLIRVVLPKKPLRESQEFVIPTFLTDREFHRGLVEVVHIERDFGPGSKMLGTIGSIKQPSCLILADDDVRYRSDFVAGLAEAQMADQSSSYSYFTYPAGGITVGQGCDGFSFWTPNVAGIESFFAKYVDGSDLMFHDDLWISFFLATKGVRVKSLRSRLGGTLIYEQVHKINALRNLGGALDREEMNVREYRSLLRAVQMRLDRRVTIRVIELFRRLVLAPGGRLLERFL